MLKKTVKRRYFEGDEARAKMDLDNLYDKATSDSISVLRGWLEQRSALNSSTALRILYGPNVRKARRIQNHIYLGCSQQEEGYFVESFIVGFLNFNSLDNESEKKEIFKKRNESKIINKMPPSHKL